MFFRKQPAEAESKPNQDATTRMELLSKSIEEFTNAISQLLALNSSDAFIIPRATLERMNDLTKAWSTISETSVSQLAFEFEAAKAQGGVALRDDQLERVISNSFCAIQGVV